MRLPFAKPQGLGMTAGNASVCQRRKAMVARRVRDRLRPSAPQIAAIMLVAAMAAAGGAGAAGDRAFGEYLASECVTCHQISGQVTGGIPAIVAWPEDQFVAVVKSYKDKERDNPIMQTIAARLSDAEMAALAAYFGSLPAP